MNAFEYKKRYDPELGRYVKKNIYSGEKEEGGRGGRGEEAAIKKGKEASKERGASKVSKKEVKKKAGDKITQLLKGK